MVFYLEAIFYVRTTVRVLEKEISHFLKAFVAETELAQSDVNGEKEHFVRIGTFGTSPPFTAIELCASGMKALNCPREAGISFRQLLNEASETDVGFTGETTEKSTQPRTEETAKGTSADITAHHTKLIPSRRQKRLPKRRLKGHQSRLLKGQLNQPSGV
jgi:hypothetical protein